MATEPRIAFSGKVRNSTKLKRKLDGIKGGVVALLSKQKLEKFLIRRVHMRFAPRGANAQAQRSPDRTPWPELKDKTKRKYNKNRNQVLTDSGDLMKAIQVVRSTMGSAASLASPTGAGFKIGIADPTQLKKARAHHYGIPGKLAPRRFLGISKADVTAVDSLIKRTLLKKI